MYSYKAISWLRVWFSLKSIAYTYMVRAFIYYIVNTKVSLYIQTYMNVVLVLQNCSLCYVHFYIRT